jgi:hypothetical protein
MGRREPKQTWSEDQRRITQTWLAIGLFPFGYNSKQSSY